MCSVNNNDITYGMRCAYIENLIDDIRCMSDLNYQNQVWIEGSIPGIIDSWEERMCMFFDDKNIDNFLSNIDPKFNFTQHQIDQLKKLRDKVDYYCSMIPQYINSYEVLQDSRWHEVVACAKETLKAFEDYQVPLDSINSY